MSKLWAILVNGSDEYCAAPSEDTAKHMVQQHEAAMQDYIAKNKRLEWAKDMCTASVVEWPFSPEEHAEELAQFDYAAWGLKGDVAMQEGGAA